MPGLPRGPALLFLFLVLASCTAGTPKDPHTLTLAFESGPATLDPRFALDAVSSKISGLMYNGLLRRDQRLRLVPDLALSWEQKGDLEVTLTLRKGVTFHDGRPFTSEDVKYTYDFILDPKNQSPKSGGYKSIRRVEALDPYTVRFVLSEPFAPLLDNLTLPIVPRPDAGHPDDPVNRPVGTGPFRFVSLLRDEEVVLEANPSYYEGKPAIQTLRFRFIPDETVRVLELEKGNVMFLMNPISPELLPRLAREPNLVVARETGTNYSYIGFNVEDPILKNREVRRAISLAIDRKGIIHYILKDLAVPAAFLFSPASEFYDPSLPQMGYEPETARRLLDAAGYPDPDGDGPLPRFSLTLKTSQNELRRRIAEVIQEQLRQVGVQMDIRSYEWGTFFSDIKTGNFQLFSLTWVGISDPDILFYIFHSESLPPDGGNRGRYNSPAVDRLTEDGRRENLPEKRKKMYDEVQRILADDFPYVSLWYSINVAVFDRRLKRFTLFPDENLISLKDAFLDAGEMERRGAVR